MYLRYTTSCTTQSGRNSSRRCWVVSEVWLRDVRFSLCLYVPVVRYALAVGTLAFRRYCTSFPCPALAKQSMYMFNKTYILLHLTYWLLHYLFHPSMGQ